MTTKEAWKDTKSALDALTRRREEMIFDIKTAFEQERDRRWAKTNTRYRNLQAKLDEIQDVIGEPFGYCEGCSEPLFDGDECHRGGDVDLCKSCAPSYGDMLASPENWQTFDDDGEDMQMTPAQAKAICDAHLAAGGSLEDKMVSA